MYLLEEAYEVLDAVERGTPAEVCGELGDLLFQILFLARLGEEAGAFDLVDVMEGITEKMVRRHPHVFGSERVETAEKVAENWARIKQEERGKDPSTAPDLSSVPKGLPALLRAHRLTQRAASSGHRDEDPRGGPADVEQDVEALKRALEDGDRDTLERRMGTLLFHLAGLAGRYGLNAEDSLRKANLRFVTREV